MGGFPRFDVRRRIVNATRVVCLLGDTKSGITKSYFKIIGSCITAVIHSSTHLFDIGVKLFGVTFKCSLPFSFMRQSMFGTIGLDNKQTLCFDSFCL